MKDHNRMNILHSLWRDLNGRTARDYAVLFKRPHLVTALDQLEVHFRIRELLSQTSRHRYDDSHYNRAFTMLNDSIVRGQFPLPFPVTMKSVKTNLHTLAFYFAQEAVFQTGLQWLKSTFELSLSEIQNIPSPSGSLEYEDCEEDLITQLVRGSDKQYFHYHDIGFHRFKSSGTVRVPVITLDELSLKVRVALFHLCAEWDGKEDLGEFIKARRQPVSEAKLRQFGNPQNFKYMYGLNEYHSWECPPSLRKRNSSLPLACAYIEQFLYRFQDEHIKGRIATMQWLLTECGAELPSVALFVRWGQFRLLRWACDEGLVDLNDKLNATPDFVEAIGWMSVADCSKLTLAEFLCALAASRDELQIFQWLFAEKI
eukprot:gene38552-47609_t